MDNISRRQFLQSSIVGVTASLLPSIAFSKSEDMMGPVSLGKTGIKMSRVAMGTGTFGSNKSSKQTKLGTEKFLEYAQFMYDAGVRVFDMADSYGSHPFVKEALKYIPREKMTLLSKLWNRPSDWANFTTAQDAVDRFRKELGVDYIDIVLMHCMVEPDWPELYKKVTDELSELKVKGVIGTYGVSCHSYQALQAAVESDWTEVILARINDTGTLMDHYPKYVVPVLQKARKKGIGVIGMKIFGGGKTKLEEQRESSLKFVLNSDAVDAITLGFGGPDEADDAFRRIKRILQENGTLKG